MIQIKWVDPPSEPWKKWKAKCAAKKSEMLLTRATLPPTVTALYKAQRAAIVEIFRGKCGFCEKRITSSQRGDIDHFRPKSAVSEEDWTRVQYMRGGRSGDHLGYYWLAYDDTNLVLTCLSCNQVAIGKRWGKGTRFPVVEFRAEEPGEEDREQPKLLHPCLDDPAEHIGVDAIGSLYEIGESERGRTTISVLGLNERGLPGERAVKFQATLDRINMLIAELRTGEREEVMKKLARLGGDSEEFAATARAAIRHMIDDLTTVTRTLGAAG